MLREEQGVDDAVEAGAKRGARGLGLGNQMPGLGACQVELAAEIGEGHVDIAHGHVGRGVAEQGHQGGEADAGTNHLGGVGVSKLVRDEAGGEAERMTDLVQVVAELAHQRCFGEGASQEPTIGGQRIEGAKEAQALDEFTNKPIHRDHTFCLQFAERDMHGPLIRTGGAEAIVGQIGALADAHAGVTDQQKRIPAEIVAAEELVFEKLILLCGQRTRESFGETGKVLAADQMGEFGKRVCSRQFLEDGAQINEPVAVGCGGQRRCLRAQARHPAEEVWIAAQLIERAYLGMNGAEVGQKLADGPAVVASRFRIQRRAEGVDGAVQDRSQRMGERRTSRAHEAVPGSGRMC